MIITIVGNRGVGKSSLIETLIRDRPPSTTLQRVMPEVIVPPEWNSEKCETRIIDTSSSEDDQEQLEIELLRADVVCIIYAMDDISSLRSVYENWIPQVHRLCRADIPIILVGNKLDLCDENSGLFRKIKILEKNVLSNSKDVEALVRCSTRKMFNVSEVFYLAQYAFCYPIRPLFDYRFGKIKPEFENALKRIFKLCCSGGDNIMSYNDLTRLQSKVFGSKLLREEIDTIKSLLNTNAPGSVTPAGITEEGFIEIFYSLLHHGNFQAPWSIIRKFGYGDDLRIKNSALHPVFKVPAGYTVELSSDAFRFLIDLFKKYDKDKDGALNIKELDELFSTSPGNPWLDTDFPETTLTNSSNAVTLRGFLMQFCMTTLLDHQTTLAYLFYLGLESDTGLALKLTCNASRRKKKKDIMKSVFLCYVFGAKGSGKTSLLRSFVNKPFDGTWKPKKSPYSTVNSIEVGGIEKSLLMQEFNRTTDQEVINNPSMMEACDVALLAFDSSDPSSFSYIADIAMQLRAKKKKIIVVPTMADAHHVTQDYPQTPAEFCQSNGITLFSQISVKESRPDELYALIVSTAENPEEMNSISLKISISRLLKAFMYTTGTSLVFIILLLPYKFARKVRRADS